MPARAQTPEAGGKGLEEMRPVRGGGRREPFFRRHSGLVAFLAAFVLCALVFGGLAYALMRPILARSDGSESAASAAAQAPASAASAAAPTGSFTMLISVYSDRDFSAVQLLLYRLDAAKKRAVLLPVPLELAAGQQGKAAPIAEAYLHGGNSAAREALSQLLSIKIDYGCDFSSQNFIAVWGKLGGLYLAVPCGLRCVLPDNGTVVTLNASPRQYLDGQKLYALLAGTGYAGATARYAEQAAVMKEFLAEKMTGAYMDSPGVYFGPVFNLAGTGYSMSNLMRDAAALKAYSSPAAVTAVQPAYTASAADPSLPAFAKPEQVRALFS